MTTGSVGAAWGVVGAAARAGGAVTRAQARSFGPGAAGARPCRQAAGGRARCAPARLCRRRRRRSASVRCRCRSVVPPAGRNPFWTPLPAPAFPLTPPQPPPSAVVGASLAEEKKAKLEKELELERRARIEMNEIASIVARYRWGKEEGACGVGECARVACGGGRRGHARSREPRLVGCGERACWGGGRCTARSPRAALSQLCRPLQFATQAPKHRTPQTRPPRHPLYPPPPKGAPSSSRASTWSSGSGTCSRAPGSGCRPAWTASC